MRRYLWIFAVGLIVAGLPASAEEIVYFSSGAALPVVSHQVDGDMVHVDLGDNAFMAFPISMVDRVEVAGKNVLLRRSTTGGTNVMHPKPDPTGSFPVTGSRQSRSGDEQRYPETRPLDPNVGLDEHGVAVYRPYANSSQANKRSIAVTGHQRVRENLGTPGALRGATQVGTRQVIGSTAPRRRPDQAPTTKITGIEFRQSTGKVQKAEPTPTTDDSSAPPANNDSGSGD